MSAKREFPEELCFWSVAVPGDCSAAGFLFLCTLCAFVSGNPGSSINGHNCGE